MSGRAFFVRHWLRQCSVGKALVAKLSDSASNAAGDGPRATTVEYKLVRARLAQTAIGGPRTSTGKTSGTQPQPALAGALTRADVRRRPRACSRRSARAGCVGVLQGDLVQLLAGRRRIVAGDAGLAQLVGCRSRWPGRSTRPAGSGANRPPAAAAISACDLRRSAARPCRNCGANSSLTVDMSMP